MAYLTIRDVPDRVKDALVADARARGQSLQAYLVEVLRRQADFVWNGDLLLEVEEGFAEATGVEKGAPRAAEVLARARESRDGGHGAGSTRARRG